MTLLDSLRDRVRPAPDRRGDPEPTSGLGWWQAPVAGALAATGSWLVLALPALVVWVATAHTSVGWGDALGVASAGWFLAHGAGVGVDEVGIRLAPLGLWLLAVLLSVRGGRRLLDRTEGAAPGPTWRRLLVRQLVPGFVGGYAGVGVLAGLLTFAGPVRPGPPALLPVCGVPLLALAWLLLRRHLAGEEAGPVGLWLDRLPRWLPRSVVPGLQGAAGLLVLGTLLVAGAAAARWSTVSGLHAAVGAGLVGGVVLTAAQLLVVPNLAVWAVAWVAGPGFQVADGSSITLSGAHPGLLPLLPVLGALPTDGSWSRWLLVLLLVPVLVGAGVGWRTGRQLARLSSWRTKLYSAAAAAAVTAVALTVLAGLGSGPVGVDRLRAVGASPLLVGAALLGELLTGAAAYVLGDRLLLRFRHHRMVDNAADGVEPSEVGE